MIMSIRNYIEYLQLKIDMTYWNGNLSVFFYAWLLHRDSDAHLLLSVLRLPSHIARRNVKKKISIDITVYVYEDSLILV